MEIREVGIVGLGTMGAGIAEVFVTPGPALASLSAADLVIEFVPEQLAIKLLAEAGPAGALRILHAMNGGYGDPAFAPPPPLRDCAAGGFASPAR